MADRQKTRVLIVDNETAFVFFVKANLELCGGYEVMTAHSGYDGLRLAKQRAPAVIVLDILMPAMNGLQILEKLKSDEATAKIPVIMSTAVNDDEGRREAERLGAAAYLVKPFGTRDLISMIDGCLGRQV